MDFELKEANVDLTGVVFENHKFTFADVMNVTSHLVICFLTVNFIRGIMP